MAGKGDGRNRKRKAGDEASLGEGNTTKPPKKLPNRSNRGQTSRTDRQDNTGYVDAALAQPAIIPLQKPTRVLNPTLIKKPLRTGNVVTAEKIGSKQARKSAKEVQDTARTGMRGAGLNKDDGVTAEKIGSKQARKSAKEVQDTARTGMRDAGLNKDDGVTAEKTGSKQARKSAKEGQDTAGTGMRDAGLNKDDGGEQDQRVLNAVMSLHKKFDIFRKDLDGVKQQMTAQTAKMDSQNKIKELRKEMEGIPKLKTVQELEVYDKKYYMDPTEARREELIETGFVRSVELRCTHWLMKRVTYGVLRGTEMFKICEANDEYFHINWLNEFKIAQTNAGKKFADANVKRKVAVAKKYLEAEKQGLHSECEDLLKQGEALDAMDQALGKKIKTFKAVLADTRNGKNKGKYKKGEKLPPQIVNEDNNRETVYESVYDDDVNQQGNEEEIDQYGEKGDDSDESADNQRGQDFKDYDEEVIAGEEQEDEEEDDDEKDEGESDY